MLVETLPGYLSTVNLPAEPAAITALVLVRQDAQLPLVTALNTAGEDAALVQTAWQVPYAAGALVVLPAVLGTYDGGVAQEAASYGLLPARALSIIHTLQLTDHRVVPNLPLATALQAGLAYVPWFASGTRLWNAAAPAVITPLLPANSTASEELLLHWRLRWRATGPPAPYPLPTQLLQLYSNPDILAVNAVAPVSPIARGTSATCSISITRLDSVEAMSFQLVYAPPGISLGSITGANGTLALLEIKAAAGAVPQVYNLAVLAVGAGRVSTLSVPIIVT